MYLGFLSPYIKSKTKEINDEYITDFKLNICGICQITLAEDLYEGNIENTNTLSVIYHKMYGGKIYNYKIYICYILNRKLRASYKEV